MRIFLAGATGAIGRRLVPLLMAAGHAVTGTTRSKEKADWLKNAGADPVIVNAFDAAAMREAVFRVQPTVVIHQLTDLPPVLERPLPTEALARNARLRVEGTANLVAAAQAAGARRLIAQSIAFAYADGPLPHGESDPLASPEGDAPGAITARGVRSLEEAVLNAEGLEGLVLRYGRLYGPGTWSAARGGPAPLHVDAAAHAALLAVTRGAPGVYNIAEDDGAVAIEKAVKALGFDPAFRLEMAC
jgi:nucleoside-diphosphate-sugar epimerase